MKKRYFLLFTLLSFILSNAQIGFQERTIIGIENSTIGAHSLSCADIDGDGDQDVFIASPNNNKIAWYENLDGLGTFGFQNIVTTNAMFVESVFSADIDGDGDIDVLSASSGDGKIAWYENLDGLGDFRNQQIINVGVTNATNVFAIDLDGDGDMDVISTDIYFGNLAWYENLDGLGSFGPEQEFNSILSGVSSIYGGDIDGDGDADVLSAYFNSDTISWFENLDGEGNFGVEQVITNSAELVDSVFAVDIDGDSDLDVVSSSRGDDTVAWYENIDGQGSFGPIQVISTTLIQTSSVYSADFDNDGDMDVISASDSGSGDIVWFENLNGLGDFGPQQVIYTEGALFVYASDIDDDGFTDVLSISTQFDTTGIAWFQNINGSGSFGTPNIINNYADVPVFVFTSDLDGDGDLDVLSASQQDSKIAWYENLNGLGDFGDQQVISINVKNATSVHSKDLDGDGDMDVISTGSWTGELAWYENLDGLGNFDGKQIISLNAGLSVDSADIDGDGDIDLFSSDTVSLSWHENVDGLGNFGPRQTIGNGQYSARSVDIDGDGDNDVIVISSDSIVWYENTDGQGNFGVAQVVITGISLLRTLNANDIDGDGDMDIIAASSSSESEIAWYENVDGLGNFGPKRRINITVFGPISVYTSDIDNDGDMDVISASHRDDKVTWFENLDGQGNFGYQEVISSNAIGANSVYASDVNGDGIIDVLSTSGSDDKIAWYENLGVLGNQILGNINIDLNSNGCNNSDPPMSNLMIETNNGDDYFATFTDSNGDYTINTNEGVFTTRITSNLPNYYSSNPNSHTSNFVGLGNMDIADFCVEPNQSVNDVSIALYPLNDARPGFEAFYQIVYRNIGTTILSGDIVVTFDNPKIIFASSSKPTSSQTSNSLTFDYFDLNPFESRTIDLTFNVALPPVTEMDDILFFTSVINPIAGDETEANNTSTYNQIVVDSYDPNDIQVLEGDEIYLEEVDEYLHYIIRFQNTGTAHAITVRVTNELNLNLEWNTLQIESISHSNRVEILDGNQVEFIFNGIYLPDSTTNEPDSHGFIAYKIKPKNTIDIGDSISNNANIYFDFNPPIQTNTVTTTVVEQQIPLTAYQPSDLEVCDDNNDGIAIFDLTITVPEIIGPQDPNDLNVTFHLSHSDATNGIIPIINTENYQSSANPETIWARLESISSGEFDVTSFNLIVYNSPIPVNPTPLEVCDDNNDGFAEFDLSQKDTEITGGNTGVSVTYHLTLLDAEEGILQIVSPYMNVVPNQQTLYARLENFTTNCFGIVTLELVVNEMPTTGIITDYVVLDEDADGYAIFDLTSKIPEIIGTQSNIDVAFYESLVDAIAETNPIANPIAYINISNPQTIYTRLENAISGCYVITEFVIFADPNLGVTQNLLYGIKIFPNPVNDILNITAKETISSVLISNVLGQVIYRSNIDALETKIVLSSYTNGAYFVSVTVEKETITKKFIKE